MSFSCLQCGLKNLEEIEIVSLRCRHIFCWPCIGSYVISQLSSRIKCPLSTCKKNINDNIIRRALPENMVEKYEKLCLEVFVKTEDTCIKCLLPECENVVFFDSKEVIFECTSCKLFNCVMCNATHPFLSCKDFQKKKESAVNNLVDRDELKAMEEKEFAKALKELENLNNMKFLESCKLTESLNLVQNDQSFICLPCDRKMPKGAGIKLRSCCHMFCKDCLRGTIINSQMLPIRCPEMSCKGKLEDREIQGILSNEELKIYWERGLIQAKSQLKNIFHCKTPDCIYYAILDNSKITKFYCQICKLQNCVRCETIHENNETCLQYINKKKLDTKTSEQIEKEIKDGLCMRCPGCGLLIKKKGGCNWMKCSSCKLELCWILQIARWGPKGRDDNSGGCRCNVNGVRCHEKCEYPGCVPE